ncbi:MAG: hypothetical protein ABIH55_02065 [Nanoarchaeota archaeon]
MMRKIPLMLMISIMTLFFLTSFASAVRPLEIDIKTPTLESLCSSEVFLELEIKNNKVIYDNFIVEIDGPDADEWFVLESTFLVNSMSSKLFKIPINPARGADGEFKYDVFVYSKSNPDFKASRGFRLDISKVCIISFDIEKTGDTLISNIELGSFDRNSVDVVYELKDENGQIIQTISFIEDVRGAKEAEHSIELPENIVAGEYYVTVKLNGFDIERTEIFSINVKEDIIETTTIVSTPLYKEVTVAITNNGNVVEENVETEQAIPKDSITGYVTNPTNCRTDGNENICKYTIPEIAPGATAYVIYRIEFWPYWATYALIGAIVVLIGGVSFLRITSPTIKKISSRKSKNRHSVTLQIKNPFRHQLKNVIVRDWVSPLARFDKNNIQGVKPVIRRSDAGTELIWRLGDIRPKEERILNYSVNTMVEGNLRMPKAYLRFRDSNDKRFRINSNQLVLQ